MVEHCAGAKLEGNCVHSLMLTDIATGWTECVALVARAQNLVAQGFGGAQAVLPFRILGLDADNDSAFITRVDELPPWAVRALRRTEEQLAV